MKNLNSILGFVLAASLVLAASVTPCRAEGYNKIAPCRLVDTRAGAGAALNIKGAFTNNDERTIPFRGNCAIPSTATAVVINLTAVGPTGAGFLAIYPGGSSTPNVSNINFSAGTPAIANQAVVRLGAPDARLVAALAGSTHVIIDVTGYFAPTGAKFHAMTPCRLLDTRSYPGNTAPLQPPTYTRLAGGQTISFAVKDSVRTVCAIPSGAVAIFANVTAVNPAGAGFFTIFPANINLPPVSTLNFQSGDTAIPNAVIVPLAAGSPDVKLYSGAAAAHAILDISGYFQ
jgi:hypothetical protein